MSAPLISMQIVQQIVHCLEVAGRDPFVQLRAAGIAPEAFDDVDAMVPLAAYVDLFERAAEASNNPHFGLYAARMSNSESLGPLGLLFLSAPTLGTAFEAFTRYLEAIQQSTTNRFTVVGGRGLFEYVIRDHSIRLRRQDAEYSIGATCSLVRQYLGPDFAPDEVHFEHDMVGGYSRYEDYFRCPVFFGQSTNRVYFDRGHLAKGSGGISNRLFPIIAGHLQTMMNDRTEAGSVTESVERLLDGHAADEFPTLAICARRLGRSAATLIRQLDGEGTSYRRIVTDRRMGMAERLLAESRRPIADIALSLGYAENASFTRAFAAHFGINPRDWRAQAIGRNRKAGTPGDG